MNALGWGTPREVDGNLKPGERGLDLEVAEDEEERKVLRDKFQANDGSKYTSEQVHPRARGVRV